MTSSFPSRFLGRYAGAVVALLVATLLSHFADPILSKSAPLALYLIAVAVVARYGGRGPAVSVLLAGGLLTGLLFTEQRNLLGLLDVKVELALVLYLAIGLLLILAAEQLRISRAQAIGSEARASASETRLRMAVQTGALGTFDVDYARTQVFWSDETCAILGLQPGDRVELDPNLIPAAVHPEDYESVLRAMQAAQDPTGPGVLETDHRILRPDGTQRWLRVRGQASFSGAGAARMAVRMIGAVQDVTEQKLVGTDLQRQTHALQERLKELECLFAVARITGQAELSPDTLARILRSLASAYRYPEVACARIELEERIHQTENFRETEWHQRSSIRASGGDIGCVEVGYTEARPAAYEGPFLKEERNLIDAVAGLLGAAFDRWRDRAALVESETRFRHLAEAMPEILYRGVLPHFNLTFIGPQVQRLLGFAPDEAIQVRDGWIRHLHDEDRDRVLAELSTARARPDVEFVTLEYRLWHKDGKTVRWFRDSAHMERNPEGKVVSFVGVLSDITELKRLEEQLREADRRKDAFLATLAHELRNPLAPIRNAFALIRRGGDRPEVVKQALEMGERQMGQLVRIVDELLDVARIGSGKIALTLEQVGLGSVVEHAVESSRPQIEAGKHQLTVVMPESVVILQADPLRLAQALSNLLNNAAKYTERGGRIRLAARVDSSGQELVIEVEDNGIGIPADMLPHIFDLFLQGAQSRHRIWQGLGVGLPLAKYLVELHGGQLAAASAGAGQGSKFSIRLPLVRSGATPQARQAGDDAKTETAALRILVVDDDKDVADSTALLLQEEGHEVQIANDGAAAIELALACRPAVVLLDIGLPDLSGYDVARRLRAQRDLDGTWLVALTGWGQEQDRRSSEEAGFDHHLVKPVAPATLEALLRACASSPRRPAGSGLPST
jgi:PAS domain S-box-containing protein